MRLPTCGTAVPHIDALRRFVATRDLGKFTHISDFPTAGFLTVNPVKVHILTFLDFFDLVYLMLSAVRAVCLKFYWHFH